MQTRRLGQSGLRVSEVGLGTWLTMGARVDVPGTARLIAQAVDLGINFFDTADVYAEGAAEAALGTAIAEMPRHHLVIATKCFFAMSDDPNDRGLSRKHVVESVEGSLRRLRTDYVDLHQCHRADPDTPIAETVRAYDDLIRQGKLLYWGVSQWEAEQIEEACAIADQLGACRPISSQPVYSIMRRGIEKRILPVCEALGIGQVVFSPLAQGALTGKYSGGARPGDSRAADANGSRFMNDYLDPAGLERVDRLRPLAQKLDVSLTRLALAWCLRQPGVSSVIVGARTAEQLAENAGASGVVVPAEVVDEIDAIFPA